MAHLNSGAALQAVIRAQQEDYANGRVVRIRFRPVNDQTAGIRRQDRALGLQP